MVLRMRAIEILPGYWMSSIPCLDCSTGISLDCVGFYGTTDGGGAGNHGAVFSLSVGLGPLPPCCQVIDSAGLFAPNT